MSITVKHIDTACTLLNIDGFKILTDPALDAPGRHYHFGFGAFSRKVSKPALTAEQLGEVDLVLLSHDQHYDNLDHAGRAFVAKSKKVLSTRSAEKRLGGVHGLAPWETVSIALGNGRHLAVTATPAQHATTKPLALLAGEVVGFVLDWTGNQTGAIYFSGDTVLIPSLSEIAERFPKVLAAIVCMGAVRFPYVTGPFRYTMNAQEAERLLDMLKPEMVFPVHNAGWKHFKESAEDARLHFRGSTWESRICWLKPGEAVCLKDDGNV